MIKRTDQLIRLTDLQLVLLTSAAQRPDGSLLPPPDSICGQAVRVRKAIPVLLKHALVAEGPALAAAAAWRQDGDTAIAVFITDAGRQAIGEEPKLETGAEEADAAPETSDQPGSVLSEAKKPSIIAQVVALLQRTDGATLEELIAATGWLPHTTRAALTGLRKKGHAITRGKRGDVTCYTIAQTA